MYILLGREETALHGMIFARDKVDTWEWPDDSFLVHLSLLPSLVHVGSFSA